MTRPPFPKLPRGLGMRQRRKADGTWRLWWEPTPAQRAAGAAPVDLDPNRPTWSQRQAENLRKSAGQDTPRRTGPAGRTVAALVEDYKASSRFRRLKPATQQGYMGDFGPILSKWSATHVERLTRPAVHAWYESLASRTPTYAGKLVRTLSVLLTYAELLGWREANSNPCAKMKPATPARRKRFATWDELDALLSTADSTGQPALACAIALAVYAGQRESDVVDAEISEFIEVADDTGALLIWDLDRNKRGNRGLVPLHADAERRVRAMLASAAPDQLRLLRDDATGRDWSGDLFRKRWAACRGIAARRCPSLLRPNLQFRDLRRTFGILARQGGAARDDIADVLGNTAHVDDRLAQVYTPSQLAAARRAVDAIHRPDSKRRA